MRENEKHRECEKHTVRDTQRHRDTFNTLMVYCWQTIVHNDGVELINSKPFCAERERERQRDRETDRQTDRQTER